MNTKKFNSLDEFSEYVKEQASKIIKEDKTIENLGMPTDVEMNKNVDESEKETGAKILDSEKGKFKNKTESPTKTPKESTSHVDPVDVKMGERNGGTDEEWATAAEVKGTNSKKKVSNEFADGLAKPDVNSKKDMPEVSIEADPTKAGGVEGTDANTTEMNKEDKEDSQETPKTQVLGDGTVDKDGFSKGQVKKQINVTAKQEEDAYKKALDDKIKTIQLPESFKSKKELISYIKETAEKISKTI